MDELLFSTLTSLTWLRLAIATATLLWAWHAAKRWFACGTDPLDSDDARLAASVCVAVCITLPAMMLGSLGWLTWPAWISATLAFVALVQRRASAGVATKAPIEKVPTPSLPFVLMVGGIAVGLALFIMRNPPTDRDSLQYHLPMWAHWVRSGNLSVALREPLEIYTAYPGSAELLQAFAGWAALDDALAPWPSIGALVLLGLVTRRLALRLGAVPPMAEAAAILLMSERAVTALGRGTQVDGLMAAWTLIALHFALRFRTHRTPRDLGVALIAIGLASGCRFTGPALGMLVLLTALAWPPSVPFAAVRRVSWIPWMVAGVLASFWLVRNLVATGNPLYPAQIELLPHALPSPLPADRLRNTTQWAMWHQGFAGHLTPANVWRFYGAALVLAAVGVFAPLLRPMRRERAAVLAFVAATFVLYIFSPFSGANLPAVGGRPPELALENVRYLLQSVALLVALGAALLSRSRPLMIVSVAACAALTLWQLGSSLPRVAFGAVLIAPYAVARRTRWGAFVRSMPVRVLVLAGASIGLALALRATAAGRDRIAVNVWQDMREHRHVRVLDGAFARSLRALAGKQPIAFVGLRSSHQLTGGDFVNQTVYLPVSKDGDRSRGTFQWGRDDRTRPDQAAWLRHVDATAPALLVLVYDDEVPRFPESGWAAMDTARFTLLAVNGRDTVYSVRPQRR